MEGNEKTNGAVAPSAEKLKALQPYTTQYPNSIHQLQNRLQYYYLLQ